MATKTYEAQLDFLQALSEEPAQDNVVDVTLGGITASSPTIAPDADTITITISSPGYVNTDSPDVEVSAHSISINVTPGTSEADSGIIPVDCGVIIDVTPGTAQTDSGAINVVTPITVTPGTAQGQTPDISVSAHKTSIPVIPGTMQSSTGDSDPFTIDEPTIKFGTSISVTPGTAESDGPISGVSVNAYLTSVLTTAGSVTSSSNAIDVYCGNIINVTPGTTEADSVLFYPFQPVMVEPASIETSSPDIDVIAYQTNIQATPGTAQSNNETISVYCGNIITTLAGTVESDGSSIYVMSVVGVDLGGAEADSPSISANTVEIDYNRTLTFFKFYITGAGLSSVAIPITSFQVTLYSDRNAYLVIVIPGLDYVDEIIARSSGNLALYMAYARISDLEVLQEKQIVEVAMGTPRVDKGVKNNSITLSGYETDAQASRRQSGTKTITLGDEWYNYRRAENGSITARMAKPHISLQAGDTIIDDDGEFSVDRITWMKSESVHHMEVTGIAA